MKHVIALALLLFSSPFASASAGENSLQRDFKPGGRVELRLHAADYAIVGTDSDRIRVTYTTDRSDSAVHISLDTVGTLGRVSVDGPTNNFHVRIELPKKTSLIIRMTAGNLEIKSVRGSKDIEALAGNLEIDVGDPESYSRVDASVRAGDLDAKAFGVEKSGLFRSFSQSRRGTYRLHAHVTTGALQLYSTPE